MDVAIIGGHGQVARGLTRALVDGRDEVRAVVRSDDHVVDVEQDGARAVLHDVERDDERHLTDLLDGADAVVFAAGAGPGSGAERKWTVDFRGAVQTMRAGAAAGVHRYVMLSSMGTDDPPTDDDVFSVYLRAKAFADAELRASALHWTVVRPGRLTDDDPTGAVTIARHVDRGQVPRADVAAVLAACLRDPSSIGHVLEVVSGQDEVVDALATATR